MSYHRSMDCFKITLQNEDSLWDEHNNRYFYAFSLVIVFKYVSVFDNLYAISNSVLNKAWEKRICIYHCCCSCWVYDCSIKVFQFKISNICKKISLNSQTIMYHLEFLSKVTNCCLILIPSSNYAEVSSTLAIPDQLCTRNACKTDR